MDNESDTKVENGDTQIPPDNTPRKPLSETLDYGDDSGEEAETPSAEIETTEIETTEIEERFESPAAESDEPLEPVAPTTRDLAVSGTPVLPVPEGLEAPPRTSHAPSRPPDPRMDHGRPMHRGQRDRDRDRRGPRHEPRREKYVKNEILVNCSPEETRVALVENNLLIELLIERSESEKIVGNIYKGRIDNVLPGISSAFVNIGLEKNAYLYVSDVIPTGKRNPSSQIEKMIARNEIIMLQVAKKRSGPKGSR